MLIDDHEISNESVIKWLDNLNLDSLISNSEIYRDYYLELLDLQRNQLKTMLESDISDEVTWESLASIVGDFFFEITACIDSKSLKIGDYYECIIVPNNCATHTKFSYGEGYRITAVEINDQNEKTLAEVSNPSDLFYAIGYKNFVRANYNGSYKHASMYNDRPLSLKLFNNGDIYYTSPIDRVNQILTHLRNHEDMDFIVYEEDSLNNRTEPLSQMIRTKLQ